MWRFLTMISVRPRQPLRVKAAEGVESLLQPLLSAGLPGLSQFKHAVQVLSQRASPCRWAGHNQPRLLKSNKVVANIATNEPTPRKR